MMRALLAFSGLLLVVVGCGGGGINSDVPSDKPASTLTTDEARRECEAVASYYVAVFPVSRQQNLDCLFTALTSTTTPDACTHSVAACLVNPPAQADFMCSGAAAPANCTATVAEVEACATADIAAFSARADMVSCAVAGNIPQLQMLAVAIPAPAQCSRLASYCPLYANGFFAARL